MSATNERVSDEVLQDIMHGEFLHHHPLVHYQMAKELIECRRGEWTCARCGLRQQGAVSERKKECEKF